MRRAWLVLAAIWVMPMTAWAQDAVAEPHPADDAASSPATPSPAADAAPSVDAGAAVEATPEASAAATAVETPEASAAGRPAVPPKVVLVVVGDPDSLLQAATLEIEGQIALAGSLRLPADASLRAALRGDAGTAEDGLEEVRTERRRLGLGEATDAPILQRLGRRSGAALVVAVREGAAGPEAVALDVSSGQFFEGTLALADSAAETVLPFITRRARAAARGAEAAPPLAAAAGTPDIAPSAATVPTAATQADEPAAQPDWFEQNWPYLAAGVLLAGAIVFVVVVATDGGDPPPMLRFQPGAP